MVVPESVEGQQDARRKRAAAIDPKRWRQMSTADRVRCYCDGKYLPCSAELLEKLFGILLDTEFQAEFKKRHPDCYLLARALWLEKHADD